MKFHIKRNQNILLIVEHELQSLPNHHTTGHKYLIIHKNTIQSLQRLNVLHFTLCIPFLTASASGWPKMLCCLRISTTCWRCIKMLANNVVLFAHLYNMLAMHKNVGQQCCAVCASLQHVGDA